MVKDIPRMRTIKQCAEIFKKSDPDTEVNEYYLRRLLKEESSLAVKSGNKFLINMDKLIDYLNNETEEPEDNQDIETLKNFPVGIRAVPE